MKYTTAPVYTEVQSLKIPALRIILGAIVLIDLVYLVLKTFRDGLQEIQLTDFYAIAVLVLLWVFVEWNKIYTRVTPEGIGYRYFPLQIRERFARWEDLKEVYIREYSALGEWGGWGLRYAFGRGWGYVAGGDWGVQLVYKNGKKRFISTKQLSELKAALEQVAPEDLREAS